jgi:cell shape-determining protein MreD
LTLIRAALSLLLALAVEIALGRWAPSVRTYVDVMMVPLAWYGIVRSQRAAMFAGCAAGLLQDAWFATGAFGIDGFVKTLLGWALGGLGGMLDLNGVPARLVAGAVLPVAGRVLEVGLLRLLDRAAGPLVPLELLVRAVVGGLLVAVVFAILDRVRGKDVVRRTAG